jgi:uncharacterized protein YjbJ (UPF0337 family)
LYDATRLETRHPEAVQSALCRTRDYIAGANWDSFSAFSNDLEDQTMNKDVFEGKWKQVRGEAKAWWGKLTDDDLDRAAGKFDVLTGLLQEKYGYTREHAANEIDKRVTEYETSLKAKTEPTPVK